MKSGTSEAMVLSEVLRSNACMIDHYNIYLNSCQDQQLRSILERQQRHTLDSFQRVIQMMERHGLDTTNIPLPTTLSATASGMQATGTAQYSTQYTAPQYGTTQQASAMGTTPHTTQYGAANPGMSPQMGAAQGTPTTLFNDKAISEGALLFHKSSAETNTRAALESSEPHIRNALTNMARNCIEMSYEVYNYMSQRGWYQSPNTPQNFISHSPTQQQQQQQQYPPQ